MRKFLVLLSAFCMIAFVGCKKDDLEPAAESEGTPFPAEAGEENHTHELEDYELAMFDDLFPYSESDVAELSAMFTDEELKEFVEMLSFCADNEPMRVAKLRADDPSGSEDVGGDDDDDDDDNGSVSPVDIIENVWDFVGSFVKDIFVQKFLDSGGTNESAMIMAMICGEKEETLMLHQMLAKLNVMDQKLDHINNIVGKINVKITNQILNDGVEKVTKVIQERNNRMADVVENQRRYWRLMAMSIGMIDANDQKTPGYNPEAMLVLSDPAKTPKDSVTLRKDSLVRNRLELFHHYLTKWYKECENKGYRAEDLVKYMTRANNGLNYPWTAAYSGVAIPAVPWEDMAGKVVNTLRAEDAAVLGVQVVMEALYCFTSRSKYITGKNIPENLTRTEINDIRENLNVLKAFYKRCDPLDEKFMAPGAKARCTIPGCQVQFMADRDINKNVSFRERTFREIINEIGEGRYPNDGELGLLDGSRDIEWWAFDEAIKRWKAMNFHTDEFNRDTCEMLTLKEVQAFNNYFINKANAAKTKNPKKKDYKTPFVQAVANHINAPDSTKKIWPDMIFVYPGDSWYSYRQIVYGHPACEYSSIANDVPYPKSNVYSGFSDFMMFALTFDADPMIYSIHRCHYHGGVVASICANRKLFYNKTNAEPAHWQDEGIGGGGSCGNASNCPKWYKNLEFKDIWINEVHHTTDFRLPSPKFKRYDIRESIINAADAAYKAIKNAEQ
ncbi:MAG: hypothetical protein HUK00_06240 [Bacteroidaceae bacterium]|nr:hypothetical protein [Bacteroidaceae bacterium]